jgi:hypothetical protein
MFCLVCASSYAQTPLQGILTWGAPAAYASGNAINPSDIVEYQIYCKTVGNQYDLFSPPVGITNNSTFRFDLKTIGFNDGDKACAIRGTGNENPNGPVLFGEFTNDVTFKVINGALFSSGGAATDSAPSSPQNASII